MIDYQELARRKQEIAGRLRAAFYGIRKQNIPRLEQSTLERLADCISPTLAYHSDRDTFLPHGRPQRVRTRHASKKAIILHEAHQAVVLYWRLVRTDEAVGLERLIENLEYYATNGFAQCELLGGSESGYTLFRPPIEEK